MSSQIDYATNRHPVFATDITFTVGGSSYADKLIVIGHSYSSTPEVVEGRDGAGDTKMRVLYDIEQSKTASLTVVSVGADASGAATNNAAVAAGATVVITSTKHPSLAGSWIVQSCDTSVDNTGLASWTINLKPDIS